jgi:hypothetical protein
MKKIVLFCLFPILFANCNQKNSEENRSITEKIAYANGFGNFGDVEEIRYTFNVRTNDSLRTSRTWSWRPQEDMVTLTTPDSTVTYNHKSEASAHEQTDQGFINDKYWLLFPFNLVWDEMEYQHEEKSTAPISGENFQKITVSYPNEGGYTPGDSYEVYFGDDHIIREWVYMPGGDSARAFATTWEDYKDCNGLNIATMHRSEDGNFELFFTDVAVE